MKRFFAFCLCFVLALAYSGISDALVSYYVDPDWGGSQTGAEATPWVDLDASEWTTIDASLATDDVTVFFSAREAGSDVNETTTNQLRILRDDQSANRITLDGNSKWNTDDGAPSWSNYSGNSKFEITADNPISMVNTNSPYEARPNVTIRGFSVIATNFQAMNLGRCDNLIVENNIVTADPGATSGPGIFISPRGTNREFGMDNVIIRNNIVHDVYSEGIYVAGLSNVGPDPHPSFPAMTNVLIEGNEIYNPAEQGGQGDGIDIKDGIVGLTIRANTIYRTVNYNDNRDTDGITILSGGLIEKNLVYHMGRAGILLGTFWNSDATRAGTIVRNNIVVQTGGNTFLSWDTGIRVTGVDTGDNWVDTKIYNNTVYDVTDGEGIWISQYATAINVSNNIAAFNDNEDFEHEGSGFGVHDNNLYYTPGGVIVARVNTTSTYTESTITSFEANSVSADPLFTFSGAVTDAISYKLKAGSPAIDAGATLSGFNDDYFGLTRIAPWEIGASEKVNPCSFDFDRHLDSAIVLVTAQGGFNPKVQRDMERIRRWRAWQRCVLAN